MVISLTPNFAGETSRIRAQLATKDIRCNGQTLPMGMTGKRIPTNGQPDYGGGCLEPRPIEFSNGPSRVGRVCRHRICDGLSQRTKPVSRKGMPPLIESLIARWTDASSNPPSVPITVNIL